MRKQVRYVFQDDNVPSPDVDKEAQIVEYKEPGYVEVINNRVYFYADIDRDKMLILVKALKEREDEMIARQKTWKLSEIPTIHLHVQSYGGWAHSGFAGFDLIKNLEVPVYTYIDGVVASAATLLTIAGTKRFIHRHAFMLIHQARYDFWGTFTHEEIQDQQKNSENLMKALKQIYLENTKIPEKELNDLMKHDLYFSAEESLKYGLVDEVIG